MQLGSSPTTGMPRIDEPLDRCEHPLGFTARFIDFADGEKCAATAERTGAVTRRCNMYPIARRPQHAERRIEILALEIPIERVGEHDNFLAALPDLVPGVDVSIVWIAKPIRAPARQTSPSAESGDASESFAAPGTVSRKFKSHDRRAA